MYIIYRRFKPEVIRIYNLTFGLTVNRGDKVYSLFGEVCFSGTIGLLHKSYMSFTRVYRLGILTYIISSILCPNNGIQEGI